MDRKSTQTAAIVLSLAGLIAIGLLISAQTSGKSEPLAEVGGEVITAEEVEKAIGVELAEHQEQIHKLKKDKIEELIREKLLAQEAARRGLSVEELLDAEVNAKVEPASEAEVEVLVEANKPRFSGDEEALRERVRKYLEERQLQTNRSAYLESLRSQADVSIYLPPPEVYRAEVSVDGAPYRGPAEAPVTIVKFEDFHCPYCDRIQTTLAELQSQYGEKVKIVHRDFPLDNLHPQARSAHEAARCAGAQGEFWAYHDALYAAKPVSTAEELTEYAEKLGLDLVAFEECLDSGAYEEAVKKDVDEGLSLGLTGTPSFFINGRLISGALPLQNFVQIIDEELARAN
jgi:protein-disulfide isomerase